MSGERLLADARLREMLAGHLAGFERAPLREAGLRPAAVAVVVAPGPEGRACFVITRRAAKLRAHPGQWALPGGRVEPGEEAVGTALRELSEEVGLRLDASDVIGQLDDYPTRSGFAITPVVLFARERARMQPDPREVAAAYEVPIEVLGYQGVPAFSRIVESDRPVISLPIAQLETAIHAPTAAILFQLWEVAVHGRATRVAHYEQPVFAWR